MKQVTDKDLSEYAKRMQEIVRRTAAINRIRQASGLGLPWIVVVEVTYLQLRHILELIATALLVVNKAAVSASGSQQIRSWHAINILDAIEDVNKEFYPKPLNRERKNAEGFMPLKDIKGDVLTKEKFVTLYRKCGGILHTQNPFATKKSVRYQTSDECKKLLAEADQWQFRIIGLLTQHEFRLKDDETMYFAQTVGQHYNFQVAEFQPIAIEELPEMPKG